MVISPILQLSQLLGIGYILMFYDFMHKPLYFLELGLSWYLCYTIMCLNVPFLSVPLCSK